jgi:hypothetical protein
MKIALCLLAFALLCAGTASAQNTRGFVYFAPGAETTLGKLGETNHAYGLGGGAELLLGAHFGVGAEIGAVVPGQGTASNTIGIISTNGYGHLWRDRNLDPFVTAGYSILFRDFAANGVNFGAGTNYWFRENVGLLLEGRDHFATIQGASTHIWEFRIGLTFR